MPHLQSREYKLLVNHQPFTDSRAALKALWNDIQEVVERVPGVRVKGKPDDKETRRILFLDTKENTLRGNELVLRCRTSGDAVEYTLKCRSEDRLIPICTKLTVGEGLEGTAKLEEDIAPPFLCRFSRSLTIDIPGRGKRLRQAPQTLSEATRLFPVLATLQCNGRVCDPATRLAVVSNIVVDETVWKGGKLIFESTDEKEAVKASVAIILWLRGKDAHAVVAELSFRLNAEKGDFSVDCAKATRFVYKMLQRMDSAQVAGMTKTEYIYRDRSQD